MVEIESESLEKALVNSNLGFFSEAIKNGVNGYEVSVGKVDSFMNIISMLWKNLKKCKELDKSARKD